MTVFLCAYDGKMSGYDIGMIWKFFKIPIIGNVYRQLVLPSTNFI